MQSKHARRETTLKIPVRDAQLAADSLIPANPCGLVVFAHGSGSSRFSPRNRFVAAVLNEGNLATILLDLLTEEEDREDQESRTFRFDIEMLATRLTAVTDWVSSEPDLAELPLGFFGASTGAAAALIAAVNRAKAVSAIVSRGGRPDLAQRVLHKVHCPTLFIVGGEDPIVLDLNRQALAEMPEPSRSSLEVIPGATHLFEEAGALDSVAELGREWFWRHLGCERCGD